MDEVDTLHVSGPVVQNFVSLTASLKPLSHWDATT